MTGKILRTNKLHIVSFAAKNGICGVMVSMLASSVVDCGFICGVMVSMLTSSVVDCGFICGVMVRG